MRPAVTVAQVDLEFRLHTKPQAPVTLSFEAALPDGQAIIALPDDTQLADFLAQAQADPASLTTTSTPSLPATPAQLTYTTSSWSTFSPLSVAAVSADPTSELVTISAVAASADPYYDGLTFQFTVFTRAVMTGATVQGIVTSPTGVTEVRP